MTEAKQNGIDENTPARFGELLFAIHDERREVIAIDETSSGDQGFSGSRIGYYSVRSEDARGVVHTDRIVTKSAVLFERKVLGLLSERRCAVPPLVIPDVTKDERDLVFMPFLEPRPALDLGHPESPLTASVADGLAALHCANRGKKPSWMARTDEDFPKYLWLRAGKEQWETNMRDPAFAREFGAYSSRLEESMDRFLRTLDSLSREGETLTVLNVDLHPDHIRLWRGSACFIDWEQSSYGSLYLDLPNHFTVETALSYRDALARHGLEISVPEFMERFHEVGRYMGLRYLGFSLWQWAQGGESREKGRWFLYYTLHLALHGR